MAFFVSGTNPYYAMALSLIELENMEFQAFHGCYPLEQVVGNRFRVSVTLWADLSRAAQSDQVGDTINYLRVFEIVREQMAVTSHILENVCARIIDALYGAFPQCERVRVKVSKIAPPLGGKIEQVSVASER